MLEILKVSLNTTIFVKLEINTSVTVNSSILVTNLNLNFIYYIIFSSAEIMLNF